MKFILEFTCRVLLAPSLGLNLNVMELLTYCQLHQVHVPISKIKASNIRSSMALWTTIPKS